MKYLVFDNMAACTEADIQRLLPLVSTQRREQALRFHHLFGQWACLKTYEMLLSLLQPDIALSQWDLASLPEFSYNEYGKPFLPIGPCFSISHCRHALAVAVCESSVGVDVESIRKADEALVCRTMNAEEQDIIARSEDAARAFTCLWTQKEAVLKWQGTGIIDDLHSVLPSVRHDSSCHLLTQDYPTFVLSIAHTPT